jgi:hypothetical protein
LEYNNKSPFCRLLLIYFYISPKISPSRLVHVTKCVHNNHTLHLYTLHIICRQQERKRKYPRQYNFQTVLHQLVNKNDNHKYQQI